MSTAAAGFHPDSLRDLLAHVPPDGRLALLLHDQKIRWQAGQPVPVEDYLGAAADLAVGPEVAIGLIEAEVRLRQQRGEQPDREEYQRRFSELAVALEALFAGAASGWSESAGMPPGTVRAGESLSAPPPPGPPPGPTPPAPPGYQIIRVLGRGGMGVVYLARQLHLNRLVALKMNLAGGHASSGERLRFLAEAEAVAVLHHPNIVQVYDFGQHDGLPFMALEYVAGGSLGQRLYSEVMQPVPAARLVEQLARAMAAAHAHGIIHRDLKPANVLLEEFSREPPASAAPALAGGSRLNEVVPKITDFGLAKRIGSALTQTGEVMGTPSYMAPEQAGGQGKHVGPAADIYALGAILYECLTGRPPFRGPSAVETLAEVVYDDPVAVRRLQTGVPRDLETICHKCLQKNPDRRYRTAEELAEELRRFQAGEPIMARPGGWPERVLKWCRRRPAVAALLAAIVLLTLSAGGLLTWQLREVTQAKRAVEVEKGNVEVEKGNLEVALKELSEAQSQRDGAQVDALRNADPGAVPTVLADLKKRGPEMAASLGRQYDQEPDRKKKMRLALALAADAKVRAELKQWMLEADEPGEVIQARAVLEPYKDTLVQDLWTKAEEAGPKESYRALVALAKFDPANSRWTTAGEAAVASLLAENSLYRGQWVKALQSVRLQLLKPLTNVFNSVKPEQRQAAADVLADYASDQPATLAVLLQDADPHQFATLFPVASKHPEAVAESMRAVLAKQLAAEKDLAGKEQLARRQANAAVVLLRLGQPDPVWPLFRHSPDPEVRSQLVWGAGLLKVDPALLVERLKVEKDVSARRALIQSLGEYSNDVRDRLTPQLLQWYRDDPDAGIHGAVDWLLRPGQEAKQLAKIDTDLQRRDPDPTFDWYVNYQGQTMVLLGPVDRFAMGSPEGEPDRVDKAELKHSRRIARRFAVASKAVTVEEFQRFYKDFPYSRQFSPDEGGPIISVTWQQAARYCNWLSAKEGIPRSDWCYEPNDARQTIEPLPDYLQRKGYRLPTEAEWEYACRAGAVTSRYYGFSDELLPRYAWYQGDSQGRAWPVGRLRPNDFGLFDMLGNAWNWTESWEAPYGPTMEGSLPDDGRERPGPSKNRVVRGGSFDTQASRVRCAFRVGHPPTYQSASLGFRVAADLLRDRSKTLRASGQDCGNTFLTCSAQARCKRAPRPQAAAVTSPGVRPPS